MKERQTDTFGYSYTREEALSSWKRFCKDYGLNKASLRSGIRAIEECHYPTKTLYKLKVEFCDRLRGQSQKPKAIDPEQLASIYRNIAPAMQEADLVSTEAPVVSRYSPRLTATYNPEAEFEPIPDWLDRRGQLREAAE